MVAVLVSDGGKNCGNGAGDAPYPATGFDSSSPSTDRILGVLGRCSRRFESGRGYCCAWCKLREIPDIVVTGSRSGK